MGRRRFEHRLHHEGRGIDFTNAGGAVVGVNPDYHRLLRAVVCGCVHLFDSKRNRFDFRNLHRSPCGIELESFAVILSPIRFAQGKLFSCHSERSEESRQFRSG